MSNNNDTPSAFILDKTNTHTDHAAKAFNKYFLNIVGRLKMDNVNIGSAVSFLRNLLPDSFPEMIVIPITEGEIVCTIASLRNKNSSDYDGISNKVIKLFREYLGKPLAHIFNKSFTLGKFLDHFKYSRVDPLFKKVMSQLSKYRLICLLDFPRLLKSWYSEGLTNNCRIIIHLFLISLVSRRMCQLIMPHRN